MPSGRQYRLHPFVSLQGTKRAGSTTIRLLVACILGRQYRRMNSVSRIFWHGTPEDFSPLTIAPRISYLEAIWLSADPEVAALYAGSEGTVHGFVVTDTACLLPTRHATEDGLVYPAADDWLRVREWLEERHLVLSEFDCLSSFKVEAGFVPSLGADGQPSWKALFDDLCETHREGEDLLLALDLQGILHEETVELALGDRSARLRTDASQSYQALARRLTARKSQKIPTLGMLDAMSLIPVCSIAASDVMDQKIRLPAGSAAALRANLQEIDCSALGRSPSP